MSIPNIQTYNQPHAFIEVNFGDSNWPTVLEVFNKVIAPIYGDQADALSKIKQKHDRICELLFEQNKPVGLLVYKNILSDEHTEYGIDQSVEIKTLLVIDSNENSGRGLGSTLIERVKEVARILQSKSIHVTVSEQKEDALSFFTKKGYEIKHIFESRYTENVKEYLLAQQIM